MSTNFVGRAIAELREKAGMSRADLAARMGRARIVINRWESGERMPALEEIVPLASALDISPQTVAKKVAELFSDSA